MALFAYLQTTQRLLSDTKQERFNIFDLRDWVNVARSQIASEGEAIRVVGTQNTAASTASYSYSAITVTGSGLGSVIAVRQIATATALLQPREWEWFFLYFIANNSPTGTPTTWAQLGQGVNGTYYLGPTPTGITALNLDVVVLPANLVLDTDAEALPYPWTDAIPYYAAYQAFLTVQDFQKADAMFMVYERFMMRARAQSTPTVLARQYPGGQSARDAATHTGIIGPQLTGSGSGTASGAGSSPGAGG